MRLKIPPRRWQHIRTVDEIPIYSLFKTFPGFLPIKGTASYFLLFVRPSYHVSSTNNRTMHTVVARLYIHYI